MDTPYRLEKLLQELKDLNCSKKVFLGMDLNKAEETLMRGSLTHILKNLKDFKREFILILGPQL
jgi:16S rRNA C1402 (ribose-2'-O) methylase RsmI